MREIPCSPSNRDEVKVTFKSENRESVGYGPVTSPVRLLSHIHSSMDVFILTMRGKGDGDGDSTGVISITLPVLHLIHIAHDRAD